MKLFHESWTDEEIKRHVADFNVLVLFDIKNTNHEAQIVIHGNLNRSQKHVLLENIVKLFGGSPLTNVLCNKINEYAEKWYNKEVLKRKARVINIKRK
jgi:hypothetical protein